MSNFLIGKINQLLSDAPQAGPSGANATPSAHPPLEAMLESMAKYGRPRLSLIKGGWYCCVEMHVTGTGIQFEIKSNFGHITPSAAAAQCAERITATVRQFNKEQQP